MKIFRWVLFHPLHFVFCSRLPGLKETTYKSGVLHIVSTCGKPAASRVLQRKHRGRAKCLWVCLLILHESLARPEFWLALLAPLPGILWQRAEILAPSKHNHICSTSTLLKELNAGWVGSQQPLGVPAVPPFGPISNIMPRCSAVQGAANSHKLRKRHLEGLQRGQTGYRGLKV